MIDRTKINGDKLVKILLDDICGNWNPWWKHVEFIEGYMPPFPNKDTTPTRVSIKCGEVFLRRLCHGRYIWDIHYGKDSEFFTQENALLCMQYAPVPPHLFSEAEIIAMRDAIKAINDSLNECLMVPANVLPAWNEIRKILRENK